MLKNDYYEEIRQAQELKGEERLLQRVTHLRQIVGWADELHETGVGVVRESREWQRFEEALALAHRVLEVGKDADQPDRILSITDPDARTGWLKGY
jgi:hypothetical protein